MANKTIFRITFAYLDAGKKTPEALTLIKKFHDKTIGLSTAFFKKSLAKEKITEINLHALKALVEFSNVGKTETGKTWVESPNYLNKHRIGCFGTTNSMASFNKMREALNKIKATHHEDSSPHKTPK